MREPCLCGAEDCRRCRPGNFAGGVYIGDCESEAEVEARLGDADEEAEHRADDERSRKRLEAR